MIAQRGRILAILLLLGSALGNSRQDDEERSLVEVAGSRAEAGNSNEENVRFISNENLQDLRDSHVSIGNALPRTPVEARVTERPESDLVKTAPEVPREEDLQFWSTLFEKARRDLEIQVRTGLVLQLEMNRLRNTYLNEPNGATQQRIQVEMARTFNDLEKVRVKEKAARVTIRDLQKDAADAGLTSAQIESLTGELPDTCSLSTYQNSAPE